MGIREQVKNLLAKSPLATNPHFKLVLDHDELYNLIEKSLINKKQNGLNYFGGDLANPLSNKHSNYFIDPETKKIGREIIDKDGNVLETQRYGDNSKNNFSILAGANKALVKYEQYRRGPLAKDNDFYSFDDFDV